MGLSVSSTDHNGCFSKEKVATIGFKIDLNEKTLFIDQIQGASNFDTLRLLGNKFRRDRFKFEAITQQMPEVWLLEQLCAITRKSGLQKIALRKGGDSNYNKVKALNELGKDMYTKHINKVRLERLAESDKYVIFNIDNGSLFTESLV